MSGSGKQGIKVRKPEAGREIEPGSHNLAGQRLGRKGRETRDRILATANELLASSPDTQLSVSAIGRRMPITLSTFYLYFNDLIDLVLALLEPALTQAEKDFEAALSSWWDEAELYDRSLQFVEMYHAFWADHARLFNHRNLLADMSDPRMILFRMRLSTGIHRHLTEQIGDSPDAPHPDNFGMVTALVAGIERIVTVVTDEKMQRFVRTDLASHLDPILRSTAELLEYGIRARRAAGRQRAAAISAG